MPARKPVTPTRKRAAPRQRMAGARPLAMASAGINRAGARRQKQGARTRRQAFSPTRLPSMRERVQARPVGLKAEWRQSVWFMIPGLGQLLTLVRKLVYQQEHLRVMKRGYVARGIASAAKDRVIKLQLRRRGRLAPTEEVGVLRNRTPGLRNTIASQHARRGRIHGVPKYPQRRAA